MRPARLVLISLVALGLMPGTWMRTPPPTQAMLHKNEGAHIAALDGEAYTSGPLTLVGAWHMQSRNVRFGGYSGLVAVNDDSLLAIGDGGKLLPIRLAEGVPVEAHVELIRRDQVARPEDEKGSYDSESLARDPASGAIFIGFEGRNAIERLSARFVPEAGIAPAEMRGWSNNSGPEAMTRLPDGRFIVIEEGERGWFDPRHQALLFPGDPTDDARPIRFTFAGITGYRPVDITPLPDGRVLILMRRLIVFGMPPRFEGAIVVADPRTIAAGKEWGGDAVTWLEPPLPTDNYEGITVTRDAGGSIIIWLISDDNFMKFQRTLLLKFRWNPDA